MADARKVIEVWRDTADKFTASADGLLDALAEEGFAVVECEGDIAKRLIALERFAKETLHNICGVVETLQRCESRAQEHLESING